MTPNLDIENITQSFPIAPLTKGVVLLFILLYLVFTLVALINIRSLDKLVVIKTSEASRNVQMLFFIYFLLVIGLFFAALVIL